MERMDFREAAKVRQVIELARIKGADAVTVLDQGGLLRHSVSRRRDIINLIESTLIPAISAMTTPPKTVRTPADMRNLVIKALENYVDDLTKKH